MSLQNHYEKENKSSKKIIIIISFIGILGIGGVLFFLKPMGDKFPFDDLLYSKSNKTGILYRIKNKGKGPRPKENDYVTFSFSYRGKKEKEIKFDSSEKNLKFPLKYSKALIKKKGGLAAIFQEAISMVSKEGIVQIQIKAKDVFVDKDGKVNKEALLKQGLKNDTVLIFEISIEKILEEKKFMKEQEKKLKELEQKLDLKHKQEIEFIDHYLEKNKFSLEGKIHKLDSGVRYIVTQKKPVALYVKKNHKVKVIFTLKALDEENRMKNPLNAEFVQIGKPNQEITFEFGATPPEVLLGWQEVIGKLRIGEKAKMWLPSKSGYYFLGNGRDIKPHTILYYEIKVVNMYKPIIAESSKKGKQPK